MSAQHTCTMCWFNETPSVTQPTCGCCQAGHPDGHGDQSAGARTCCCGRVATTGQGERHEVPTATCPDCPRHGWTDDQHGATDDARCRITLEIGPNETTDRWCHTHRRWASDDSTGESCTAPTDGARPTP